MPGLDARARSPCLPASTGRPARPAIRSFRSSTRTARAFRLNGYRLPGETAEQVKQTPVSLGAEAYERIWPETVYPSTLPGNVPFALNVNMASVYASSHDASGTRSSTTTFSFRRKRTCSRPDAREPFLLLQRSHLRGIPRRGRLVHPEHVRIDLISPFGPEHLFNFRIGKQTPNLFDGFQGMWLMTDNGVDTLSRTTRSASTAVRSSRTRAAASACRGVTRAIEMYGVAAHRLFYSVGEPVLPDRTGRFRRAVQQQQRQGRLRPRRLQVRRPRTHGDASVEGPAAKLARELLLRLGVFG